MVIFRFSTPTENVYTAAGFPSGIDGIPRVAGTLSFITERYFSTDDNVFTELQRWNWNEDDQQVKQTKKKTARREPVDVDVTTYYL